VNAQQWVREEHEKEAAEMWWFSIWMGLNTETQPLNTKPYRRSSRLMMGVKTFFQNLLKVNGEKSSMSGELGRML